MPLTTPRPAPTRPMPAAQGRPWITGLRRLFRRALPLALCAALTAPATAQSPFSAAVWVNDDAITFHEIDQRSRFLEFIGGGGPDVRTIARERLIEDRLQLQVGRRFGLRATPEQITEGMAEFASRVELSTPEFLSRLQQAGVSQETFREFVHAGIVWRELVQGRFGPEIVVTEPQIDRALSVENVRPVPEILISEIFLPADPQFAEIVQQLIPQILEIDTLEEFALAAREVSAAPSGQAGGRVDNWLPLRSLPEPIAAQFETAVPGQIIGPVDVPGAFAIFQLRAKRETRNVPPGQIELEFRRATLPGGRTEANLTRVAELRIRAERCADFGPVIGDLAPTLPMEAVETVTLRQPQLSTGLATELARLDPGEISANLVDNGQLIVLQLCARRFVADPQPTREQARFAVFGQQIERRAEVWLQTLRAEAEIRTP
ncbi:peptidylprolyl isomerase [Pararhodobacter sp. SW119]|uniref:peptidylprolyl isomerase n=1 Tax=Pararhodobacter sp. SW119 TaxID=2780075 RepID=UPI001AE09335|nr:peptidylprolyl isomerase [Pararhodobacter sp. SW119]